MMKIQIITSFLLWSFVMAIISHLMISKVKGSPAFLKRLQVLKPSRVFLFHPTQLANAIGPALKSIIEGIWNIIRSFYLILAYALFSPILTHLALKKILAAEAKRQSFKD
jgi:hypothetical protein